MFYKILKELTRELYLALRLIFRNFVILVLFLYWLHTSGIVAMYLCPWQIEPVGRLCCYYQGGIVGAINAFFSGYPAEIIELDVVSRSPETSYVPLYTAKGKHWTELRCDELILGTITFWTNLVILYVRCLREFKHQITARIALRYIRVTGLSFFGWTVDDCVMNGGAVPFFFFRMNLLTGKPIERIWLEPTNFNYGIYRRGLKKVEEAVLDELNYGNNQLKLAKRIVALVRKRRPLNAFVPSYPLRLAYLTLYYMGCLQIPTLIVLGICLLSLTAKVIRKQKGDKDVPEIKQIEIVTLIVIGLFMACKILGNG